MDKENFVGSILGLAVADAIGAPWEGLPADMVFSMGPAEKIVQHQNNNTIYYTDDTQMTIGVAETLINHRSIDREILAANFAENYHPDRGYGQGARRIINAIGRGENWEEIAENIFDGKGSLGNGAAMRVAPVGLFFSDKTVILDQAEQSAITTHRHEIGIDAARIIAMAVSLALNSSEKAFDRTSFLTSLRAVARTEEFQWQLDHALHLEPFHSLQAFGNSLEAHRSVVTSLMCFADSPDDYGESVTRAVGQGNDVDTIAAMAGAMSGARLGLSGIPNRLLACLENGHQGKEFLTDLADQLWAASDYKQI